MDNSIAAPANRAHLLRSEIRPRMAKVHSSSLRKTEIDAYRQWLGACIGRAWQLSALTLDQFADELDRDSSQVGKWIKAVEPPQADAVLMSTMRAFFLQAMAEKTAECEVETTIKVRRRA